MMDNQMTNQRTDAVRVFGQDAHAVRYQAVCSLVRGGAEDYLTYGLQCLGDWKGTWVQMDVIEDVSPSRDNVIQLASRFNDLHLSPLHFRDVVLDCVNA